MTVSMGDAFPAGTVTEPGETEGTTVSMGDALTVKGDNSFGRLFADEVETQIVKQQENNGCNIFSIEMSGSTAAVSFETVQYATLLVGIYDEARNQMLASGKVEVSPEETMAYVDMETDAMPDYYYVKGFLIDSECLRPLCVAYESPNYTREMQEFLTKSTDDFDADKVLNLDEDKTNNFAVYKDEVVIIPSNVGSGETAGVNNVAMADDVNGTYVIENIDSSISSLQPGDIFTYEYGENNILIVKVAAISIEGTTACITGAETAMDEVFDYVKIDTTTDAGDVVVDESTCGEGVTYDGDVEMDMDEDTPQTYDMEGSAEVGFGKKFSFMDVDLSGSAKLSGSVGIQVKAKIKIQISPSYQYMEVVLDYKVETTFSVSGKSDECSMPLAYFTISPFPGVYIAFTPSLVFEISAELTLTAELSGKVGFSASPQSGVKNLSTTPKPKTEIKGEVTAFFGISMEPKVVIITDKLANAALTVKGGGEVKAALAYSTEQKADPASKKFHECTSCVDGDITAKLSAEFKAEFLKLKNLELKASTSLSIKVADFYYSLDFGEFDFTSCPHYRYRVSFMVKDDKFQGVNAVIRAGGREITTVAADGTIKTVTELVADEQGCAAGYLPSGRYSVTVDAPGYSVVNQKVTVEDDAASVCVWMNASGGSGGNQGGSGDGGNQGDSGDGGDDGEDIVISGGQTLSLGDGHSGVITEDGSLYMWGLNNSGQVGNGSTTVQTTPVKVLDNVETLALGGDHSGAITKDGSLYMWGMNDYGQVGNGSEVDQLTPVKVLDNAETLALRVFHSGAITKDGSLYMWGENGAGQVGNGSWIDRLTPVKVLDNVETLALGNRHSGTITKDGSLYMWGMNYLYGQVGNGSTANQFTPVKILDHVKISTSAQAQSIAMQEFMSLDLYSAVPCSNAIPGQADFTDLLPDETYNFYAVKDRNAADILSPSNLLYITQAVSDGAGSLSIFYQPAEQTDNAVTFVIPMSQTDLSSAQVEMEDLAYTGEMQYVSPVVKWNGNTLTQGINYELAGDYCALKPGSYTVTIQGVGLYKGSKDVSYQVLGKPVLYGDANGDGSVNSLDAVLIKRYLAGYDSLKLNETAADVNSDGRVSSLDAVKILQKLAGYEVILGGK